MRAVLLLLLAVIAVCIRSQDVDVSEEHDDPVALLEEVTKEVLGLIEVAVKLAQYTAVDEKMKAVGWVQNRLDNIKKILQEEPEPDEGTTAPEVIYHEDCRALLNGGFTESGLYDIYPSYPETTEPMEVYCDQETDGGGWIVFQRRTDGSQSFEKTWDEYRQGFGDLSNEFWLGNDNLVLLTRPLESQSGDVELRVDIRDWDDNTAFAQYETFAVQGDLYTLTAEDYLESSTAGNPLDYHTSMHFTTKDNDNDRASGGNCAVWMRGGWWHNYCLKADPNGPYLVPGGQYGALSPGQDQGVTWTSYTGHGYDGRHYSLKGTEMKLRRAPQAVP